MNALDLFHLRGFRISAAQNPFVCTFNGGAELTGTKTGRSPTATQAQPNTSDVVPEVITLAVEDLPDALPGLGDVLQSATHSHRIAAYRIKGPVIHYDVDPAVALP